MECQVVSRMEAGDHFIVYATVLDGQVQSEAATAVHHRKVIGVRKRADVCGGAAGGSVARLGAPGQGQGLSPLPAQACAAQVYVATAALRQCKGN